LFVRGWLLVGVRNNLCGEWTTASFLHEQEGLDKTLNEAFEKVFGRGKALRFGAKQGWDKLLT
jgi:hypothetical protein